VTDALTSLLMACILLSVSPRQTSGMVLCLVLMVSFRIRRITLTQISFAATCFGPVLCPAIIIGPSTGERGIIMEDNRIRV
jgi:hypothetical protein